MIEMSTDPTQPTESTDDIVWSPVDKVEVELTLEDILTPLTRTAAADPQMAEHVQQLDTTAAQLKDIVSRINELDPTLLAPRPTEQA
jgi:hypothetical protein